MKAKKYFEDYWNLCKETGRFYKDHWFGTLIVTTVGTALSFSPMLVLAVKDKIELRKWKKQHEQREES